MRARRLVRAVRTPLAVLLAVSLVTLGGVPAGASHVDPGDVIYVLPPDRIPAIMAPTFARSDWLAAEYGDAERVLAVVIDGDARAYPLRILNWHEIVNDVVAGVPVAATFCPLCGSGITFDRTVADTVLSFKVSGRLYKNDLVMYDVESGPTSWWPQILGEAITGPWHGTKLTLVSSTVVPWGQFKAAYPGAKLLERPTDGNGYFIRDYSTNPYGSYGSSEETLWPARHWDTESGLHPKEFVHAVTVRGVTKVYPYRFLATERVVNDVVGGVPIVVTFALDNAQAFARGNRTFALDGDAMVDGTGDRFALLTGRSATEALAPADGINAFWFAVFDHEMERAGSVDVYRVGVLGQTAGGPSGSPGSAPAWLLLLIPLLAVIGAIVWWRQRSHDRRGDLPED